MINHNRVSLDKRYEFITSQIRYFNEKIIEAFKLFIQILSAIVGGSIWLSMQDPTPNNKNHYWILADIIVACLAVLTTITVIANILAWWGYRRAEHQLNPQAPLPRHIRSYWNEFAMLAVIVVVSCLFFAFNPL